MMANSEVNSFKEGEQVYLISNTWVSKWLDYVYHDLIDAEEVDKDLERDYHKYMDKELQADAQLNKDIKLESQEKEKQRRIDQHLSDGYDGNNDQ